MKTNKLFIALIAAISVASTQEIALAGDITLEDLGITVHESKTVTTTTTQGSINVGKVGNSNVFVHGTSHSTNMNTTRNPPEPTKNTKTYNSFGIGFDF